MTFPATNGSATGTVTQITPQSTVTNNVVLFPITVALDTAPPGVKVGSTASLTITDGIATGVLEVPTAAITTVGTNHTVTRAAQRRRHRRPGRGRPRPARRPPRSRAGWRRATCSCCRRRPRPRRRAAPPARASRGWAVAGDPRTAPGHRAAGGLQDLRQRATPRCTPSTASTSSSSGATTSR